MKKMYDQGKLSFSIVNILLYILIDFVLTSSFGMGNIVSLLILLIYLTFIIRFIYKNNLNKTLGFIKVKRKKKYLYFLPLIIINIAHLYKAKAMIGGSTFICILSLIIKGILLSIIFFSFLYKSLGKKRKLITILVFSGINFINILLGADPLHLLINFISLLSISYLYINIFDKSKSIMPIIFSLSVYLCFSVYTPINYLVHLISSFVIIVVNILYIKYLGGIK